MPVKNQPAKSTAVVTPPPGDVKKPTARTVSKVGNLTKDWEVIFSAAGKLFARNDLAVNGWGERLGETDFYGLVVFGTLAENLAECTGKGTRLLVSGKPQVREWEREDGSKGSKKEIIVNDAGPDLRFCTVEIIRAERSTSTVHQTALNVGDDEEPF